MVATRTSLGDPVEESRIMKRCKCGSIKRGWHRMEMRLGLVITPGYSQILLFLVSIQAKSLVKFRLGSRFRWNNRFRPTSSPAFIMHQAKVSLKQFRLRICKALIIRWDNWIRIWSFRIWIRIHSSNYQWARTHRTLRFRSIQSHPRR